MKKLSTFITIVTLILWVSHAHAENSGAAFLRLGVGARPIGMGSAFVAIANDANAVFWNPGGLSQIKTQEISAMHTEWLADINYDYVGYIHPFGKNAVGLSMIYLCTGDLDKRSATGADLGSFEAYDGAFALSYARKISSVLHMGMNIKLIQQKIEEETAEGFAIDIGQVYSLPMTGLSFGLAVQNIGPDMKFVQDPFKLPLTVVGGVGYSMLGVITVGVDVKHLVVDEKTSISFGTEYSPVGVLSLRAGYLARILKTGNDTGDIAGIESDLGGLTGLGAGMGFRLGPASVDYAFVPYGDLGNTHRISFLAKF
ncbi:MAG: PorV/PorQ family protein [bacterium]